MKQVKKIQRQNRSAQRGARTLEIYPGRSRDTVGAFTRAELELIEELVFTDAKSLGFYGDKVVSNLSATIPERDIAKIPRSGHFLFKGTSTETYRKIRRDLGDSVILTSGIRSVVKQIYLFMNKAEQADGNLSLASYSLAPPGHPRSRRDRGKAGSPTVTISRRPRRRPVIAGAPVTAAGPGFRRRAGWLRAPLPA